MVGFPDSRNDFIRTNSDGSHWVHFQAVNALVAIGYLYVVDGVFCFDPIFSGTGEATGSFTVEWVEELQNWTADLLAVEWRWNATLTEMETGAEYPFFLHVVIKDEVFLRDDLRFAPLGLGD